MSRTLIRLDAAPSALSFEDEDGQLIALAHGDIVRLVLSLASLEIHTSSGERLTIEQSSFDSAGSLGHEASGDAQSDFERIVQVVHYYAGDLELERAEGDASISSGDLVVEETADGSTRDDTWMTEVTVEADSISDEESLRPLRELRDATDDSRDTDRSDPFAPQPVTFGDGES